MSRQTIGENPLDAFLTSIEKPQSKKKPKLHFDKQKIPLAKKNKNQRLTIQISEEVLEKAKNAVYWTRGLTLAQLTENALEEALFVLEKKSAVFDDFTGEALKSKGDPFPDRKEELKSGRPVK